MSAPPSSMCVAQVWRSMWQLAAGQNDNGNEHEHLEIGNLDENGEPLQFDLRKVIAMANMEFTTAAVSAKGKGEHKSLPVYPKAKSLAVRDLAVQLLDDRGGMRADLWASYVRDGKVCNQR